MDTRSIVLAEWTRLLGPPLSDSATFEECGGHRLLLARLIAGVADGSGCTLALDDVPGPVTVAGLVDLLNRRAHSGSYGTDEAQMNADLELRPAAGQTASSPPTKPPRAVLLTGATGYLGNHLLIELLRQSDATIHCLLRGHTEQSASARLRNAFRMHRIELGDLRSRIRIHLGDLAESGLGLSSAVQRQLGSELDAIVHCGAEINFVQPYASLRAVNVGSVAAILGLAAAGRPKSVHFLSTLGVAAESGISAIDESPPPRPRRDASGYLKSKFVAEQLVLAAREAGTDAYVHRPWTLMGHTRTGATDSRDFTTRILSGSIALGAAPMIDVLCNVVPVDYVASAIVRIATTASPAHHIFHYTNPNPVPLRQIWSWASELGYPVRQLTTAEWLGLAAVSGLETLAPVLPLVAGAGDAGATAPLPTFSSAHTDLALSGTALRCPPVDRELLAGVLDFLGQEGVLPPSTARSPSRKGFV